VRKNIVLIKGPVSVSGREEPATKVWCDQL
jgi:hypothetical protein